MITFTAGKDRKRGLDGLRALAVGAVVAFHAGQHWAAGGYLGVDAFFVLSGFLITGLLLDEHARSGRIRLREFWGKRMARLIPALAVMVTVVMAIAAATHADALRTLRVDAVSALGYVGNWRFLIGHRGYFGQTAPTSLFEHTWSLAIEEQFYLVWPLVMVALLSRSRRPRVAVGVAAAAGAAASAIASVALAHGGAGTSRLYFGTDTRIQAILIGATLAAVLGGHTAEHRAGRSRSLRDGALHVVAVVGLAVTAFLWWRLSGSSPALFRGGTTVAALATAAMIPSLALVPDGVVGRALGVAPLSGLGVISYGVYLWHWPIQLLLTGSATGWRGPALFALRAEVTIAAALVSYALIERPLRERPMRGGQRLLSFTAMVGAATAGVLLLASVALPATSTTVSAAAAPVAATSMVPTSIATTAVPSTTAVAAAIRVQDPKPAVTVKPFVAPTPTYRMEVLGDSVAASVADGLAPVGARYGLAVVDDAMIGCGIAPVGGYRLRGVEYELGTDCANWENNWIARVGAAGADVIVIQAGRHEVLDTKINDQWVSILSQPMADAVARGLDRAIEIASAAGRPIVLLTAPFFSTGEAPDGHPWPENDPQRVVRFNQLARDAAARHSRTSVVDLGGHTNPNGRYAATVAGVPMRKDGVHYTAAACQWFAPWLSPQVRAVARV